MFTSIHPILPLRNKSVTRDFCINKLDFEEFGTKDFEGYLMVQKDNIQIHPNSHLKTKPRVQKEFALSGTDNNLLTFGQTLNLKEP